MPRSRRTSPGSPRGRPRHVVAVLHRQDNRLRFQVYAYEQTHAHDAFLNRLLPYMPSSGATRDQIRKMVARAGDGAYRLYYNHIVYDAPGVRRRLSF